MSITSYSPGKRQTCHYDIFCIITMFSYANIISTMTALITGYFVLKGHRWHM